MEMSANDNRYGDLGLTVLRVVTGIVFFMHGYTKVLELLGGLALIVGLGTRWISVPLAITMVVAILKVHLGAGFFAPNGYEFPLMLLAGTVGLTLSGGGALAVDNLLAARRAGTPARSGRLATAS
jgi:putative oxidoreductase